MLLINLVLFLSRALWIESFSQNIYKGSDSLYILKWDSFLGYNYKYNSWFLLVSWNRGILLLYSLHFQFPYTVYEKIRKRGLLRGILSNLTFKLRTLLGTLTTYKIITFRDNISSSCIKVLPTNNPNHFRNLFFL